MAEKTQHTVIVGGGLSGLSAAYYIKKNNPERHVTLLEKNDRLGGIICTQTIDTDLGSCTVEFGPDSFLPKTQHILQLINDLNLSDQLTTIDPHHQKSFIFYKNKLQPTPLGFYLIAPKKLLPFLKTDLLSWKGKCRAMAEVFISRSKQPEQSLEEFVTRRFGQELFEVLAQAMVSGIYTSDPKKLSLNATLPMFIELEKKHGSVILGLLKQSFGSKSSGPRYNLFYSFKNGMSQLVDTLEQRLISMNVSIKKSCAVSSIGHDGKRYMVKDQDGQAYDADKLIVANALRASEQTLSSFAPELSQTLHAINTASSAIAVLAYKKSDLGKLPPCAGFVIPSIENRKVLACSVLSQKFPSRAPQDIVLLRVFMGGVLQADILKQSDAELLKLAHHEMKDILNISGHPIVQKIQRWTEAMPQYELGHSQKIEQLKTQSKRYPGLHLLGNYMNGVGLSDVIKQHF